MVSPGSANIAPPPLIRRTTVIPSRRAWPVLTSLRSDWKLPMMTAGAAHSQIRSVGGRRPAAPGGVRRYRRGGLALAMAHAAARPIRTRHASGPASR